VALEQIFIALRGGWLLLFAGGQCA